MRFGFLGINQMERTESAKPVVGITPMAAIHFAAWCSEITGKDFDLLRLHPNAKDDIGFKCMDGAHISEYFYNNGCIYQGNDSFWNGCHSEGANGWIYEVKNDDCSSGTSFRLACKKE